MAAGTQGSSLRPHASIRDAQVAILMGTKNGAAFLGEQLQSIARQTYSNWVLIASDDGSTDATKDILERFVEQHRQPTIIRKGAGKGACANFLSMAVDPTIDADYFAFCDQDDIWNADKLERALSWFTTVPEGVPAFYCGRTELMSATLGSYALSPLFTRPPTFRNALVQSLGGGNTMVFNRAAKKLLEYAGTYEVVLHDWWVYQLVTAAGGLAHYDPLPVLKYRQHADNLIGSNQDWHARFVRFLMILSGRFSEWNETNVSALRRLPAHLITPENRETLEWFAKARSTSLLKRLLYLKRSGVYRQKLRGNFGLLLAAILKKL